MSHNNMEDDIDGVFSVLDYCLFFFMLLGSLLIGIYFGFFGKKQDNPTEYLYGGKSLKIIPVAASLLASDISGVTFLGLPADIYMYGTSFSVSMLSSIVVTFIIAEIFLPVFYKLQVTSCYEYLKLRYGNSVCVLASGIFALTAILYMPVVVYIPALAFSQVSGFNLSVTIPLVCVVTVFYTTIGGIKAVVWTDTLQIIGMLASLTFVFIMGIILEGGFSEIWMKNEEGGRIDFNLSVDPTSRTATLTIFIGTAVLWLSYGINPVFIQRFLSVPTLKHAKITCYLLLAGNIVIKVMSIFIGLTLFAHYQHCDPLSSGKISKFDQIIPYYITSVASYIPGIPGLFIAGIFCAALSTLSSGLNTMAGTIYKDLLSPKLSPNTSDRKASNIMKLIVVIIGFVTMLMVYGVQYLGGILRLSLIIGGLSAGPLLAMFSLGMTTKFTNLTGVICGSIAGIAFVGWILFGAQYYTLIGRLYTPTLPLSVDGCSNITYFELEEDVKVFSLDAEPAPYPYRISFHYYSLIGFLVTTIVAIPLSLITGGRQQKVHKDLLSSAFYSKSTFLPRKQSRELQRLNRT